MTIRRSLLLLPLLLAACGSQPPRPVVERSEIPAPAPQAAGKPATTSLPSANLQKRGGGYYRDDGPGDNPPSPEFLDAIVDAEPRLEPLHRFANKPYSVFGRDYLPMATLTPYTARGVGSWYGRKFHGQKTSSGEIYDMYGMSAAHPTLPIPSYARVSNPANGKSVVVRVNDRGPFHSGRLIDLSYAAAWKLGYIGNGSSLLEVESILPGGSPLAAGRPPAAADPIALLARQSGQATAKPAPAPLPEVKEARGVFLQLGAFGSSDNAENLKSRLGHELAGLANPAELDGKLVVQARGGLYRVQFGPWQDHAEAQRMAEKLREAFEMKSVVVRQ